MNKILIIGHPQSGYEEVEKVLVECGMRQPLPSRREGLAATKISETLVKAHGAVPVEQIRSPERLRQIEVAPLWQGMALDLMLANIEQRLWGWADTQAVYLLDYWKSQDPQIVFVLAYDEPQTIYIRGGLDQATTPKDLKYLLNSWLAYNAALLHFHLRNPQRSLLVHVRGVRDSAQRYVNQIRSRIDVPLQEPSILPCADKSTPIRRPRQQDTATGWSSVETEILDRTITKENGVQDDSEDQKSGSSDSALALTRDVIRTDPLNSSQSLLASNKLATLLADQLVSGQDEVTQLYHDMQAAATLPYDAYAYVSAPHALIEAPYEAWHAFLVQQTALQEALCSSQELEQVKKAKDEQARLAQERQTKIDQLIDARAAAEKQTKEYAQQLEQAKKAKDEQARLAQERQSKIDQLIDARAVAEKQAQEHAQQLEQAKKNALTEYAAIQQENHLLLAQLHHVQEELELRCAEANRPQEEKRPNKVRLSNQEMDEHERKLTKLVHNPPKRFFSRRSVKITSKIIPIPAYFDEAQYLRNNPDVAAAVTAGGFIHGFHHFLIFGKKEGRSRPLV